MPRTAFNIIGGYNVQRDKVISFERAINMYPMPIASNDEKVLAPASGHDNSFAVGSGPIREQFVFGDNMYVVSGDEIYSVDSALTPSLLGSIGTSSGYVGIAANQTQVMFVDGVNGYIWDTVTSMFNPIVFGFPINPSDVTSLDNYFFVINNDTNEFYQSALGDGHTWNVLDKALFLSKPDQLVAIGNLKRRVYLFGNISTEVWYDAGFADFALRRDNNILFEHGCANPKTLREGFEMMFYLATNSNGAAGVMMISGINNPVKISSSALDLFLQNAQDISDAEAFLYKENELTFYQLSFPTDNRTFVYIVETGLWHELSMPDGSRHPATAHAFFFNKHYIGIFDNNLVYELSWNHMTYGGELIRCIRITPPLMDKTRRRIQLNRFEIGTIPGIPEATFQNQQNYPDIAELVQENAFTEIILFISRDGGRTFGNGKRIEVSKVGQYNARVVWHRLGVNKGRRIVFWIEYPYKTRFYILDSNLDYEVLPE